MVEYLLAELLACVTGIQKTCTDTSTTIYYINDLLIDFNPPLTILHNHIFKLSAITAMAPHANGTMSNSTAERASNDGPPSTPPKFLVIGAGSRGNAYGGAVTRATPGVIHAVAEIDPFKRRKFGRKYIWGDASPKPGQEFASWTDWLEWETARRERKNKSANTPNGFTEEDKDDGFNDGDGVGGVDGVFVCTLDEMHVQILLAIAPLNLHILCEKPLATSLDDCLAISSTLR